MSRSPKVREGSGGTPEGQAGSRVWEGSGGTPEGLGVVGSLPRRNGRGEKVFPEEREKSVSLPVRLGEVERPSQRAWRGLEFPKRAGRGEEALREGRES